VSYFKGCEEISHTLFIINIINMCKETIIGISENETCCIESSESLSGFYLDDMDEGFIPVNQTLYVSEFASELLLKLITNATNEVIRESQKYFDKYLNPRYTEISTYIGNIDNYTDIIVGTDSLKYLCFKPKFKTGGTINLKKIIIKLQDGFLASNFTLYGENKEILYNGSTSAFTCLKLPLNQVYYIAYQSNSAPLNFNHLECCGNRNPWSTYLYVGSGSAVSIENITWKESDFNHGVYIEADFSCDTYSNLCDIDFKNSKFGVSFAHSVKQTARKNFAYWLLTSDKVTPYMMVNKEEIASIIEFLKADIKENLIYLPTVYNLTNCYVCRENSLKSEIII
jgi:hypothetical protein